MSILVFCVINLSFYVCYVGGKLKDGIAELRQNLTFSPPSVPSEKEHASCDRIEMDLPFFPSVTEEVLHASNRIWIDTDVRDADGARFLWYSLEADIIDIVRSFMKDVLRALKSRLNFSAEPTIKQIRPDLCLLLMYVFLVVGVTEAKKPGNNEFLSLLFWVN